MVYLPAYRGIAGIGKAAALDADLFDTPGGEPADWEGRKFCGMGWLRRQRGSLDDGQADS